VGATVPYLRHLGGATRTICSFEEKLLLVQAVPKADKVEEVGGTWAQSNFSSNEQIVRAAPPK
jgi:hypothetical protein